MWWVFGRRSTKSGVIPGLRRRFADDLRTPEQIREHYELEKSLASRLRQSTRAERRRLYGEVYSILYASLPHHPRNTRRESESQAAAHVESQMQMVRPFLAHDVVFFEVGCGDGSLLREVATHVKLAIGLEVSVTTIPGGGWLNNTVVVTYDGVEIPLAPGSATVAYSSAVMEHLHPDDAATQVQNIALALKPGGVYVLYTPHRFAGPGDVSKYYDTVATGFHLKEYTFAEVGWLLRKAGFSRLYGLVRFRGRFRRVPLLLLALHELALRPLPHSVRYRFTQYRLFSRLLQIRVLAVK